MKPEHSDTVVPVPVYPPMHDNVTVEPEEYNDWDGETTTRDGSDKVGELQSFRPKIPVF